MIEGPNCRLVSEAEWPLWEEFVLESAEGCLFHTSTWKRLIDSSYGGGTLSLVGAFDGDELVGGCVALERTRMGQLTAVVPLLTPYTGFWLRNADSAKVSNQASQRTQILSGLARWMHTRYSYQKLTNVPELEDVRPLVAAGYLLQPRHTFEIDLTIPASQLLQNFGGHVRRQIKKAEKHNFEYRDDFSAPEASRLFADTFQRRGEECPVARAYFEEIVVGEILAPHRVNIAAFLGTELVSFICLLHYKNVAYYAIAATAQPQLSSGISSLMIWQALEKLQQLGIARFDFVGANIPSIAKFKEGFNPTLRTYYLLQRYRGLHIKLAHKLLSLIR